MIPRAAGRVPAVASALVALYLGLAALYGWQASQHMTPTIFTDELRFAQVSRSLAETAEPALRGAAVPAPSLYAYLAAPAWWIDDVGTAYGAIKLLGVLVMTAVVFPTYGLARLVVQRPWALAAAAGAGAAPALAYAPFLVDEPLAYPLSTLTLFATARFVARPTARSAGLALAAALAAYLTRSQLAILFVVLGLAGLAVLARLPQVRAWRVRWTRGDTLGAAVLGVGAAVVAGAVVSSRSTSWYIATTFDKEQMLEYGLWAAGALAIGIGILPAVAGLAALVTPKGERLTDGRRAFVTVAVAAIAAFGVYTAVKAAYLARVFAILVYERNLIYLVPVLFTGTMLFLERRRGRSWAVLGAGGLAAYLVVSTPYDLSRYPDYEAHGLAVLALANRLWRWPGGRIEDVLLGVALGATLALLAVTVARRRSTFARAAAVLLAATTLAWTLAAQIYAANGEKLFTERFYATLPKPADWLDRTTRGAATVVIGQSIADANQLHLLEFWNRSVTGMWSLDGTAPGPGRVVTPNLERSDGTITDPETDYVLTVNGVDVAAQKVGPSIGGFALYRLGGHLRLARSRSGVYPDGWMGARARFAEYDVPEGTRGFVTVRLSRVAWGGTDKPGKIRVRIGPVVPDENGQPAIATVTDTAAGEIHSSEATGFALRAPPRPWLVEIAIEPTFSPRELDPSLGDARQLGAVVSVEYRPIR